MHTYANNALITREFANCDTSYGKDMIEHCKVTILIVKLKECFDLAYALTYHFFKLFSKRKKKKEILEENSKPISH